MKTVLLVTICPLNIIIISLTGKSHCCKHYLSILNVYFLQLDQILLLVSNYTSGFVDAVTSQLNC